jgi:transposase
MIKNLIQSIFPWAELEHLRRENADLRRQLQERDQKLQDCHQVIANLTERISELERRLGLNSGNSSKPPSSDGLRKKPAPKSLRPKGEKKSGGQEGHQGHTLKQVDSPDHIIFHAVESCSSCSTNLRDVKADRVQKRQVFDIPEPKINVTEHQAEVKTCLNCGQETSAIFPKDVNAPAQYGDRIKAFTIYFQYQQFIPEDRLADVFEDIFGLPISTATMAKIGSRFSGQLDRIEEEVISFINTSEVKGVDESGFRVSGKTQWLHVLSHEKATHYRFAQKRGDLPLGLSGTVVHDHFKPYYSLPDVKHALCNAHHLRELRALEEIEKEPWASKMYKFLIAVGELSHDGHCREELQKFIHEEYDKIISEGLLFHESQPPLAKKSTGRKKRRVGHNLLIRLRDYKLDALRCLSDPLVPFTNNQSERDIRMIKVKQKISGGFKTEKGAQIFCKIRSFMSTAKKQQLNLLDSIASAMKGAFSFGFS